MILSFLFSILFLKIILGMAVFVLSSTIFKLATDESLIVASISNLAINNQLGRIPRKLIFLRSESKRRVLGLALCDAAISNRLNSTIVLQAFGADLRIKNKNQDDSLDLALRHGYWDIATSLIYHSIVEIDLHYYQDKFLKFYDQNDSKPALIIFSALNPKLRSEMINYNFGKLMNLTRNNPEYFRLGFKIANERLIANTHDSIERNGYLALHWTKNSQISNGLALLFPYLKSKDSDIRSKLYLVYYFLGLCYFSHNSFNEALRSFEMVQNLRPNYFQTLYYINKIKEKSDYSDNKTKQYEKVNLKDFSYYEILGITPNATKEEIKKAYHQKIRLYHPDKFSMMGKEHQDLANEKSKEINEAYSKCLKRIS
jgi:hypothetical protein